MWCAHFMLTLLDDVVCGWYSGLIVYYMGWWCKREELALEFSTGYRLKTRATSQRWNCRGVSGSSLEVSCPRIKVDAALVHLTVWWHR